MVDAERVHFERTTYPVCFRLMMAFGSTLESPIKSDEELNDKIKTFSDSICITLSQEDLEALNEEIYLAMKAESLGNRPQVICAPVIQGVWTTLYHQGRFGKPVSKKKRTRKRTTPKGRSDDVTAHLEMIADGYLQNPEEAKQHSKAKNKPAKRDTRR